MKLKTYDASVSQKRKGTPAISFSKSGLISLSQEFCDKVGMKPGDKVLVHQDEENPEDWYISKSKEGFELRAIRPNSNLLGFNSSKICEDFRECFEMEKQSVRCRMATEPVVLDKVKYYGIITKY